jgi:hypothetical protein
MGAWSNDVDLTVFKDDESDDDDEDGSGDKDGKGEE